jgi:prepilin-type N-terminal cleavage/methylation domain-containing protein
MSKIENLKFTIFRFENRRFVSSFGFATLLPRFAAASAFGGRVSNFGPKRARGFTMIELLVVLAIIMILTAVAVVSVPGGGTPKQQLRREARDLIGLLKEGRQAAMERKLKVDVYLDPTDRTVCAVESGYGHQLVAGNVAFADLEPATNRFFKITTFPEEILIEAFSLDDIEPEATGEEPLFTKVPKISMDGAEVAEAARRPAFSFTHLGGATGGGVSLTRNDLRLDIACDLLTGLPMIVQRRAAP